MENQSYISEVSSVQSQPLSIPEIHLQQFILDQYARNISQIYQPQKRTQPRIFTVAQTLKDPLILKSIKPDYGSLGQFIGDVNISKDLLSQKKRKNQVNDDEMEEKKSRVILKDKTQDELNNIYINNRSGAVLKKMAGRLLVENIFKQSFGMSINSFENEVEKEQRIRNIKINLSNIEDIFNGKITNINKNDPNNNKKQNNKYCNHQLNQSNYFIEDYNQEYQKEDIKNIVDNFKNKYSGFKKLEIKDSCQLYDMLVNKHYLDCSPSRKTFDEKTDRIKIPPPGYTIEITESTLLLQKLQIKPELMLYLMSQFPLNKLETVELFQIRITEETLLFMLDVVKMFCKELKKFCLRNISIQKSQNIVLKIKEILEVLPLKELNLECMDLQTKEFCVICLGIGTNNTLEILNFDNNSVDERGCKSLQLISKHCQQLKKISLRKNYLKAHHLSYFSVEAKSKIVL